MPVRTIVKLVLLAFITILALVAVFGGRYIMRRKSKKSGQEQIRLMVRVRMGCFLAMLILLLICVVI